MSTIKLLNNGELAHELQTRLPYSIEDFMDEGTLAMHLLTNSFSLTSKGLPHTHATLHEYKHNKSGKVLLVVMLRNIAFMVDGVTESFVNRKVGNYLWAPCITIIKDSTHYNFVVTDSEITKNEMQLQLVNSGHYNIVNLKGHELLFSLLKAIQNVYSDIKTANII